MVARSCEGWVGAVSVGMMQVPKWCIHRGSMCAEWSDIVALGLEVRVWGGIVGKRGEGVDLFCMSAHIGGRLWRRRMWLVEVR